MIDIYNLLNSRDIKKYLKDIEYSFNPNEMLYIILTCNHITLKEKLEALKDLSLKYPDFVLEPRESGIKRQTLKEYVESYIKITNKLIEDYYKIDNSYFYNASFFYYDDYCFCDEYWDSNIWHNEHEFMSNDEEDAFEYCYDEELPQHDFLCLIKVTKTKLNRFDKITAIFMQDHTLVSIDSSRYDDILSYYTYMWIDIPTPFKKGDILYHISNRKNDKEYKFDKNEIYILEHITTWDEKDYINNGYVNGISKVNSIDFKQLNKKRKSLIENGDESDMCIVGKKVLANGQITYDDVWSYLDFEYYRGCLDGDYSIYKLISNFYKGEIDVELLLNSYYILRNKNLLNEKDVASMYTKEGQILSGLKECDKIKIYLDDTRVTPYGYIRAKSVNECKEIIEQAERDEKIIEVIDCDHDLGDFAFDGGDGIKLLDWLIERNTLYPIELHTQNPVGRDNMQRTIDRYWKKED